MAADTLIEASLYNTTGQILELMREFESCTLRPERWTHAAHLTVALWYLLQYDWPEAVARTRDGIKRYNESRGIAIMHEHGYHETITLFWLRVVRSFLDRELNEGRALVMLANELIEYADENLPLKYYARERLFSCEARETWAEPDLKPLAVR
ncbi:MAG: hypothetical protein LC754_16220 [Acidobacteria bacterium]|nr:hypothetical protein [Acidobacteriota bacterium]